MNALGEGRALVLVPGIQGRWEWMRPTAEALAKHFRVLVFSLRGDPGSDRPMDPSLGFDNFVQQIDDALAWAREESAVVCGVSYGGLVAIRYAAGRQRRVRALVIASTPGPAWRPDARVSRYVRMPWRHLPHFVAGAPLRVLPEIVAAHPTWRARARFTVRHLWRVLASPMSPPRMAERIVLAAELDFAAEARRVMAPVLVVTGEARLDRVVPVQGTLDYLPEFPDARHAVLEGTGHLGVISKADRFAETVARFVEATTS